MTLQTFDRLITIFLMPTSINSTPKSAITIRFRRLFTTAVIRVVHFMLERLCSLYTWMFY